MDNHDNSEILSYFCMYSMAKQLSQKNQIKILKILLSNLFSGCRRNMCGLDDENDSLAECLQSLVVHSTTLNFIISISRLQANSLLFYNFLNLITKLLKTSGCL